MSRRGEWRSATYLYTRDLQRAFSVSERLETGMVGLNKGMVSNAGAPFGGMGHSGVGREGGPEGIEEHLEIKYVAMNVQVCAAQRRRSFVAGGSSTVYARRAQSTDRAYIKTVAVSSGISARANRASSTDPSRLLR